MSEQKFQSFAEFWPFYVGEHRLRMTRVWHFIGTSLGLISLLLMVVTGKWWLLFLGLWLSYGCAWASHFFIEKNRPATFKYPFYSFLGDFQMYLLMWQGKMADEVTRLVKH